MLRKKKLLIYKVRAYLKLHRFRRTDKFIIQCGFMLLQGKGSLQYDLYDLLVLQETCAQNADVQGSDQYLKMCWNFVSKHSETEFISNLRTLVYDQEAYSSDALNAFLHVGMLLNDFYSNKFLTSFVSGAPCHADYLTSNSSFYDALLCILVENSEYIKIPQANGQQHNLFSSNTCIKLRQLLDSECPGLRDLIMSPNNAANPRGHLSHMTTTCHALYGQSLFAPVDTSCSKYWWSSAWEREDLTANTSICATAVAFLFDSATPDILRNRKFYVREKGVIVRFSEPFESLSKIYLQEFHDSTLNLHYIFARTYRCENDRFVRDYVMPIDDIRSGITLLLYESDYTTMLMVLGILGVLDEFMASVKESPEFSADMIAEVISMFTAVSDWVHRAPWVYEEPIWWNYDTQGSHPSEDSTDTKRATRSVHVGCYTRLLPKGQQASSEARGLANKYHINLKPGYTFVNEFDYEGSIKMKTPGSGTTSAFSKFKDTE